MRGVSPGERLPIVFTKGQNWGFPPMQSGCDAKVGTTNTRSPTSEITLRFARLLRIDHVMGLHRSLLDPGWTDGRQRCLCEYPAEELYAILTSNRSQNRAGIVGENLGTVPPIVNTSMDRHNIQQMYVVQYEV